jgi:putative transposase
LFDSQRVSENTGALMRDLGLAARRSKRRRATTRPGSSRWWAPDLVRRSFGAGGINLRWYGDGTEIVTGDGRLYLDSVLDMGSRRIVGHALGERHDAGTFRQACQRLGVRQSMGRPGSALDNAVIES